MKLEDEFPGLQTSGYTTTSDEDEKYNCIAWAADKNANKKGEWWEPHPAYHWPRNIPREYTVNAYSLAFQSIGYSVCPDDTLEHGFEKVALYVGRDGTPSHMARQLPNGAWTSKLGEGPDIEHANLTCLQGDSYGQVKVIFRRPITDER